MLAGMLNHRYHRLLQTECEANFKYNVRSHSRYVTDDSLSLFDSLAYSWRPFVTSGRVPIDYPYRRHIRVAPEGQLQILSKLFTLRKIHPVCDKYRRRLRRSAHLSKQIILFNFEFDGLG